jgi:hypothetical protein
MIILRQSWIEQQREFGIAQNIYKVTGAKRIVDKLKGKALKKLNGDIEKHITQANLHHRKAVDTSKLIESEPVNQELQRVAKRNGSTIINDIKLEEDIPDTVIYKGNPIAILRAEQELKNPYLSIKDRAEIVNFRDRLKEGNVILHHYPDGSTRGTGTASLAHEVGHVLNSTSKGVRGLVHRSELKFPNARKEMGVAISKPSVDNSQGIIEAGKRFLKGRLIVAEEQNATNQGLKLIKNKMAPKDYEAAKTNLGEALGEYKEGAKAYWKIPLRNKLKTSLQGKK